MATVKVRGSSGKTWAKLTPRDLLPSDFLQEVAKVILDHVRKEARKDMMKPPSGSREGMPQTENFLASFSTRIEGQTIILESSWPTILQLIEGRQPYPMTWLTQQAGVSKVPMPGPQPGTVLIRTTPKAPNDAWMHPGFQKHNFVRRGFEKARKQIDKMFEKQLLKVLSKTSPL